MRITVIRNAAWAVAWDAWDQRHVYLRDVDVAFEDRQVSHVGKGYEGAVDTEIDGRDRRVMPGLVNIHSHPPSDPLRMGITDGIRNPGFYHSSSL